MALKSARVEPPETAAFEAAVAQSKSLEKDVIATEKEESPSKPESLELHGKQLAAAFAGMMVSPKTQRPSQQPLILTYLSSFAVVSVPHSSRPDNSCLGITENCYRFRRS